MKIPLKNEINHFFHCLDKKIECMTGDKHCFSTFNIINKFKD